MIELVKKWAAINSHSHNKEGLKEMADLLYQAFSPLAKESLRHESGVLHFKRPVEGKPKLLLVGHYDTVYAQNHPIEEKELYLYGPGVADMKGGLVILLFALKQLKDKFSWEVLLNPDEEIGSKASMPYMIETAKKGFDYGFIFEPALSSGALVSSRPASGNFLVHVKGQEAHAGRNPEAGKNAIFALCELIYHFSFIHRPADEVLLNAGTIQGGTAVNVIPGLAVARVNLRTKTNEEFADNVQIMNDMIQEVMRRHRVAIELEPTSYRPQKLLTTRTKLLMKQFEAVYRIPFEPSRGACDANDLSHYGFPFVDALGPVGHDLHSPKERLLISSLEERLQLFLKALDALPLV